MSTSVIPKSVARTNHNITVGWGEVPAIQIEGNLGWGLPGGTVTFCKTEATRVATQLNSTLKRITIDPKELIKGRR